MNRPNDEMSALLSAPAVLRTQSRRLPTSYVSPSSSLSATPNQRPNSAFGSMSSGSTFTSGDIASKYPQTNERLMPYMYPTPEDDWYEEDDDLKGLQTGETTTFPWRGVVNVSVLVLLILGLATLFVLYPIISFYRHRTRAQMVLDNQQVNNSGQVADFTPMNMPSAVDRDTPEDAQTRTGFDGEKYILVFSDEFNSDGRTFYPGEDPYWEASDLWYGVTADMEWYDPRQVTTRDGNLVITMDSVDTLVAGMTPNSSAPFTAAQNHDLNYRSGMLQSWNKFCFSSGYIEVSLLLPGPNSDTTGYWPGVWAMGNLARPGYRATTDGLWPYTYDSCDIGTFPNQTNKEGTGPVAALHSDASRSRYNNELSWLSGQRLSACTCPKEDHPGPVLDEGRFRGRGAPEIDVLEAEKDKLTGQGHVVSQSAQFAPFSADYLFQNETEDEWKIYDPALSRMNTYHGSAVQQAVSALARVPDAGFVGLGAQREFVQYGFEYWADTKHREDGFITWMVDGKPTTRLGARAMGADAQTEVGQRLIPEEPMSIVINLGISENWQEIDLATMVFPAEMLVDYVRVYQREDAMDVGCSPEGYPTKEYIEAHKEAYSNPNVTTWGWANPRNSLYDGC
ncbi:glycoside hydrolase family 16 protein [Cylindrobasidium torrendii FP15055 ss-10]|uniref:Glycoside hydrolase family 16 protein n=1 Tax=Cylindrobasidium torrendii FP15055 ss-10 TaxID=1314674 RepID=A0A0D7B9V3_9AGAR|nr:glycoside hydrolase family 16 protein [Cylindrobasidium torrendii FP15055 ss-10]